jgi:predicted alpha/beta superfamily hydrolase
MRRLNEWALHMTSDGTMTDFSEGLPVEIPSSKFHDFTSAITGREYRIFMYTPDGNPPDAGFPVFYVLDGGAWFGTVVEAVRSRSLGFEVFPAVIVGIGYRTSDLAVSGALRFKDLSTPASQAWIDALPYRIPGLTAEITGGADLFLDALEREIKPAVAKLARIDASNQSLFGHSLGGLTVLRALFRAPQSFRSFIASSPSIWWNGAAILEGESAFADVVRDHRVQPRVLIEAGGLEQTSSPSGLRWFKSEDVMQAALAQSRMIDNAKELGARLAGLKSGPAYEINTVVFPDEGHGSVVAAALSRAVSFALGIA